MFLPGKNEPEMSINQPVSQSAGPSIIFRRATATFLSSILTQHFTSCTSHHFFLHVAFPKRYEPPFSYI
ncbi:uncharacterized protein BO95DRAFT_135545 [Aspergillus brunneoviolaceus CBS 621.78]|uniref:Uncharacterized protein n=1 Tax=Aspergillus brunneoviolaceus CBS 621.78 TaxID=1450534 RepID=A0ACD1G8G6_9EURO|nr:hypothetical protein BO95DRAFT_135545 [Aspergillus brunneoviolaceus CBS 621.78]RAH45567.1 hypothetical protein BO95DRAFT_135545 [Aspergillus brunneoviolaceus CBS 621.78]